MNRIQKEIVTTAWETVESADVVILLVDGTKGVDPTTQEIIHKMDKALKGVTKEVVIIVNKVEGS
jgi:predicted GTPase